LWDYFSVGDGKVEKDALRITHDKNNKFPNKHITFPVGLRIPYPLRGLTAAEYIHEVFFAAAIATVKRIAGHYESDEIISSMKLPLCLIFMPHM
jgi:hypothetical protein